MFPAAVFRRRVKMWRLETLRADISRPLAAAVEEILGLFEKTISEYEEKVSRLQEENNDQRELLDAAPSPRVVLHRAAFPPELQQLSVCKEELPPEQQEWSPSLGHEEPEPPHIKEEEEEFPMKTEPDEECAQWSQFHQSQTVDIREAEPVASTSTEQMEAEVDPKGPASALGSSGAEQLLSSHCSEPETEDSGGGWKETTEPPSVLPPELQQLSVCKEELPPEQQEWSPSLGQEEPEPPHIKEEEEEFPMKTEHDEECPQWSQLHQSQTGDLREQMEGEVDDPAAAFEPSGAEQLPSPHCFEPETEDSDAGWKETTHPLSDLHQHSDDEESTCQSQTEENRADGEVSEAASSSGPDSDFEPASAEPKSGVNSQMAETLGFSCPGCRYCFTSQIFLHKHIKKSHSELYVQQLRSGEIRAESLLPSAASQPIGTSGTTRTQKEAPGSHSCDQCGKTFRWPSRLKEHQTIHTGERSFHCQHCEKTCSTKRQIKVHQSIHSGERPYQCLQCAKSFRIKSALSRHQRIHTGERSYHCEHCGKSFYVKNKLTQHQRCHTGDKPYQCVQCGKRFNVKRDLNIHQHIHTGQKAYHCEQCGKTFTAQNKFKLHQRIHTAAKP